MSNDWKFLTFELKVNNCIYTFIQHLTCSGDAVWSAWSSLACKAPCGQKGTTIATRKCRGPPECCPGEWKRIENCTSLPCY